VAGDDDAKGEGRCVPLCVTVRVERVSARRRCSQQD